MEIKSFDNFFAGSPVPMLIIDLEDYSVKNVNDEMLGLYGYKREEMISFTLFDLRDQEEVSKLKERLPQLETDKAKNEGVWKHRKKNGDAIYVSVLRSPITFEEDGKTYQLVMYNDVTNELNTQQRFEMLFEHSIDGIMLTNPNGDILQANKAACEILGMLEEEIIEKGREGIVVKDEKLEKALQQRSETGEFAGELTYLHKSGREIPVELTTSVFTNYEGEQRTSLIFRDISERKEAEKALRHEKKFNDVTLSSLPGVFFVLNERGETVKWNAHSTDVFGLTDEEINGQPAEAFVHDDDKELIRQSIAKVFEEGHTRVELKLNTAEDTTSIYDFIANRFQQGEQTFIAGSGVNVTKQKKLEKCLQSSLQKEHSQRVEAEAGHDKLKKMFEQAPTPKCLLEGPEFRFVIANKAYREMIGKKDIIGSKVIDVMPEVEKQGYISLLNQVYETGETYVGRGEKLVFDKDNEEAQQEYIFNYIYEPLFDDNGEVYGIFVEAMDFSEQIAYQEKLEESLEEKMTLLHEIHHRVKNNLAIISSMMELQAFDSDDPVLQNALRVGQQRIQAIASIHELLYQSDKLSHLNFGETTKKISQKLSDIYGSNNEITLHTQIEPINLNVNQAIPCGLIINELLTNAFKHAFEGREDGTIEIHLTEEQNRVEIKVKDDGIGIPQDVEIGNTSTIGMTLVNVLKQQLEADFNILNGEGTSCRLSFEKSEVKGVGSAIIE